MESGLFLLALLSAGIVEGTEVARVRVESVELSNGMRFLAVRRPELTTVSAGFVARVGSVNEKPGITGMSHFFEHMIWMESDRLLQPVFREFYAERDVIHEERRLRIESTPTGEFDEAFDSVFWQSHPHGWPVVGWPSDLRSYTLSQAKEYFATYYAPNNLTAALVGNFELEEVHLPMRDPLTLNPLP